MAVVSALFEILHRPTFGDVLIELIVFIIPLWIALLVGILVGWAWKPKWANLGRKFFHCSASASNNSSLSSTSSFGMFLPSSSTCFGSIPSLNSLKLPLLSYISRIVNDGFEKETSSVSPASNSVCSNSSQLETEKSGLVTEVDLKNLRLLVEEKDGGPAWIQMMDRSTPNMSYRAWRRDRETGPPQYRSRTIYENATPEMIRDFFWDDESRLKWDDMLTHAETLWECPTTGTMVVQWVRKFPFFCSDREYIIGRRVWESNRTFYCVTKNVPCNSVQRRNKPRRVDLYYSSWCIHAVESVKGDGQLTACEVLLFHYEDMGIPWEIAKLGVQKGMWGAVKKIDPALRIYQRQRASGAPLSRCAFMPQNNTKVSADYLRSLESTRNDSSEVDTLNSSGKPSGRNIPKLLVIGGAFALACSLDQGLLTKVVIFGVARQFARIVRRL